MPLIIGGKRFHQINIPGPKLTPEYHHQVLTPITVSAEGVSDGSAKYKAEHMLAQAASDADEVIIMEYDFSAADLGVRCMLTGAPIAYLTSA